MARFVAIHRLYLSLFPYLFVYVFILAFLAVPWLHAYTPFEP